MEISIIQHSQSTNNPGENGKKGLWATVNRPVPTGAVFKLPGSGDELAGKAEEVGNNLYFANGGMFDKTEKYMYVSKSMMDRVLRFRDVESGSVSEGEVYQNVYVPDNLAVDSDNNLWIASLVGNKVMVVDNTCRAVHTVFQETSTSHSAFLDEWTKRSHLGQPRNEVLTPEAFNPLPNFLTGLFFSPNFDTVYLTGLGNAILKYAIPKDQ